jgi:uncharacterized protein (DUF3084 family)
VQGNLDKAKAELEKVQADLQKTITDAQATINSMKTQLNNAATNAQKALSDLNAKGVQISDILNRLKTVEQKLSVNPPQASSGKSILDALRNL